MIPMEILVSVGSPSPISNGKPVKTELRKMQATKRPVGSSWSEAILLCEGCGLVMNNGFSAPK